MIGHVAANDLPLTELVTADYTFANEVDGPDVARGLPRRRATGWQQGAVHWDGRPAAGILSGNGHVVAVLSPPTANANRKRANQVSRMLLCHDYLNRPIDFDRNVNLLDEEAVATTRCRPTRRA